MNGLDYQIWVKAEPLKKAKGKKRKTDVLFSSDFGKKILFKIFNMVKSETILETINRYVL